MEEGVCPYDGRNQGSGGKGAVRARQEGNVWLYM